MDASFSSFLRAEEKDRLGPGGKPPAGDDGGLQGNPALKPPLNKGLKIFAPKKRTNWGMGASPLQGLLVTLQAKAC